MKSTSCRNCGYITFGRTCPNCGYINRTYFPSFFINRTGFIIIIVITFLAAMIVLDYFAFNSRFCNRILYGTDCSYQVPPGYKIVYYPTTKLYAIRVLSHNVYYLYNGKWEIVSMFPITAKPSLFIDSCNAKAYLKAYIKQHGNELNNYK